MRRNKNILQVKCWVWGDGDQDNWIRKSGRKIKVEKGWKRWTRGRICSAVRFVIYSNIELRLTYVRRDQRMSVVKIPTQSKVQLWAQTRVVGALAAEVMKTPSMEITHPASLDNLFWCLSILMKKKLLLISSQTFWKYSLCLSIFSSHHVLLWRAWLFFLGNLPSKPLLLRLNEHSFFSFFFMGQGLSPIKVHLVAIHWTYCKLSSLSNVWNMESNVMEFLDNQYFKESQGSALTLYDLLSP